MKRLLVALMVVALAAFVAVADQKILTDGTSIRAGDVVDTLVVEGATDQVTCVDSNLTGRDDFWIGATLTVVDQSSNLTDTTRTITDWDQSTYTLTFATFATDSIEDNDSISLAWPKAHPNLRYEEGWVVVQATIDTSEVYRIPPGASVSSQHIMTNIEGLDSVDTRIYLEIAIGTFFPDNLTPWYRVDSITSYASVDTSIYQAWGAIQANYIRFVLDPNPNFDDNGYATHYGRVMVDE